MERIRITLINSLPRIRLVLDRFVQSMRIQIHHIDYAIDQVSAFLKMEAKILSRDITNAIVSVGIRFPTTISHIDYDRSSANAFQRLQARIHSVDYSKANVKASLNQFTTINHTDFDRSRVSAMLVYPVLLGDLAEMTSGYMADETLGALTFSEIQI